jgi:hypothetical protein
VVTAVQIALLIHQAFFCVSILLVVVVVFIHRDEAALFNPHSAGAVNHPELRVV